MDVLPYIGIIICIVFSAFFSGSEIAFASANKIRLRKKAESSDPVAKVALNISENFNDMLSTILIGNNFVNIAATSISTVIIINIMGSSGTIVSTLVMTIIILIFGEITPKIIANKFADRFVLIAAYPLRFIMMLLKPLVRVVVFIVDIVSRLWQKDEEEPLITEEELVAIIENVEDEGIINKDTSNLLQSTLEFSNIPVSEIITPRTDMVAVDIEDDINEIIDIILNTPYSRIPVYEKNIDNIIGVIYVGKLLDMLTDVDNVLEIDKSDIRSILIDGCFVHQTMKLPEVFKKLNSGKLQMDIVTDEYGGTMGCVTMEDILEELVGEIWDENDEIFNDFVKIDQDTYEVSGNVSIREFADYFDLDYKYFESQYSTIGGWLVGLFNRYPKVNESIKYHNLVIKVLELDSLRISKILVKIKDNPQQKIVAMQDKVLIES